MSYKLENPNGKQRLDFIVEYNHKKGLMIKETSNAIYALEPWENLNGDTVVDNREEYEAEQAKAEQERISMLSLTAADVERAIYKAKGMDFEDVLALLSSYEAEQLGGLDLKALKIELKANNFYRGNPYIEAVGALLGFTPKMLDEFFEDGDYTKLVSPPEDVTQNEESESEYTEEIPENSDPQLTHKEDEEEENEETV